MTSQVFYASPIPLSQPAVTTRLAALAVASLDTSGQLIAPKLIHSKCAPHTILSPTYLFKQAVNPENLQHGLTGLKFYEECTQALTPSSTDDILVAFSMRHMTVLNALALQNLSTTNILTKFHRVLDLKVAFATCAYFGEASVPLVKNLAAAARSFQYPEEINKKLNYPSIMNFLYQTLLERAPKIMSYLLRPKEQLMQTIMQPQHEYMVYIDDNNRLCLIRRLSISPDQRYLKALCLHQAAGIDMQVINLDLAPLLAPLGILTPERQHKLQFDLNENLQRLSSVDLNDFTQEQSQSSALREQQQRYLKQMPTEQDTERQNVNAAVTNWSDCERAFYERFIYQLPAPAQAIFQRPFGTPLTQEELGQVYDSETLPGELSRLMLFYQYENFPKLRTPELSARYRAVLDQQTLMREPLLINECTLLRNNMASFTSGQMDFLNHLLEFFSNCYTR